MLKCKAFIIIIILKHFVELHPPTSIYVYIVLINCQFSVVRNSMQLMVLEPPPRVIRRHAITILNFHKKGGIISFVQCRGIILIKTPLRFYKQQSASTQDAMTNENKFSVLKIINIFFKYFLIHLLSVYKSKLKYCVINLLNFIFTLSEQKYHDEWLKKRLGIKNYLITHHHYYYFGL